MALNVLILGGTGLISTPVTRLLAERGDAVTVYNRARRSAELPAGVRQIVGDRYDRAGFARDMEAAQMASAFDVVIEMIGYKPEDVQDLRGAFAGRIGQLIFCSTVDVYSKPPARYPITDDASQESPAPWGYAENKAKCEALLREAFAAGDFPVTFLRPAHTYGDGGALLHSLGSSTTYLDRLRKGRPLVVHGDGQSLWTSCHAEDVARAFVNACDCQAAFGKGYHLPGDEWLTWDDIHRTVAAAIGAPEPTLVHIPTDLLAKAAPDRAGICAVNFQYDNIFDTGAAKRDLDFAQTIPFAEGARRVYDHLDHSGGIADSDSDPLDDRIIAAWERLSAAMVRELNPG